MFLQRDLGTSVPMRLYTMTKCYFVIATIAFFLIIGFSVILGIVGPSVSHHFIVSSLNHPSVTSIEANVYEVNSLPLSVFHRELWLSAIINRAPLEQNAKVSVSLNTSIKMQIPFHLTTVSSGSETSKHDSSYKNSMVQMGPIYNRTVQLNCPETKCDELFLFHLIPIDFTIYKFIITFYHEVTNDNNNNNQIKKYEDYEGKHFFFKIINVDFIFQYYTTEFTYMELIVKFILFIISEVITVWFYTRMKRFSLSYWTIEQCCLAILLPLLILYNNPLYPLQYLTTNWFPSSLDYFFHVTLIAALLFVWLCIFHGIRVSKRTLHRFYLPKICFISIFWLIIFLLITWKTYVEYHEPVFNILEYTELLIFIVVFIALFGFIYLVLFTVLLIRACHKLRKLPYFNLRLYFLAFQSMIFTIVLGLICLLHFNRKLLPHTIHNYIHTNDDTLNTKQNHQNYKRFYQFNGILGYNSTLEFSVIQFTVNSYISLLAFVYSPPNNAQIEMDVKDNPSQSMINDSDEDVIYESDTETKTFLFSQRTQ
ncbi:Transmembrane protein 181 [Schistosoma japonicum]|nr:Transmembrane protein 181 [Schistosoma japonicum]